jgi:transcriptional regulator
VSHAPLELFEDPAPHGRLRGHLARANHHWHDLEAGCETLVIFQGPNAYVSPSWYPSKKEHGKVVPTWNYLAVHAYCKPRCFHESAELIPLLRSLTEKHEGGRKEPWAVDDAPADYLAGAARGIVGFELEIVRLEGKRKLSQNRSAAEDRQGVREGLRTGAEPDRRLADLIPE